LPSSSPPACQPLIYCNTQQYETASAVSLVKAQSMPLLETSSSADSLWLATPTTSPKVTPRIFNSPNLCLRIPAYYQVSRLAIIQTLTASNMHSLALSQTDSQTDSSTTGGAAYTSLTLATTQAELKQVFQQCFGELLSLAVDDPNIDQAHLQARIGLGGSFVQYIDSQCDQPDSGERKFQDLLSVGRSMQKLVHALKGATPDQLHIILTSFPPADANELLCIEGTRVRITGILLLLSQSQAPGAKNYQQQPLSKAQRLVQQLVGSKIPLPLVVKDSLEHWVSAQDFLQQVDMLHHVHLSHLMQVYLGINETQLEALDAYYASAHDVLSAIDVYNLQNNWPLTISKDLALHLKSMSHSGQNLARVLEEFTHHMQELVVQANGFAMDEAFDQTASMASLKANPLGQYFLNEDCELDLLPFLFEDQTNAYQVNWQKIQHLLDTAVTEFFHLEPAASLASYGCKLCSQTLIPNLSGQLTVNNLSQRMLALEFLHNLGSRTLQITSLEAVGLILNSIANNWYSNHDEIQSISVAQLLNDIKQSTQQMTDNIFAKDYIDSLIDSLHANYRCIIQDDDYQLIQSFLNQKPLQVPTKQELKILHKTCVPPYYFDRYFHAKLAHKDKIKLAKTCIFDQTNQLINQQLLPAILNYFIQHHRALAAHLIKNIDAQAVFDIAQFLYADDQWQALDFILKIPKTIKILSDKKTCLPTALEPLRLVDGSHQRQCDRILDGIRWQGHLKSIQGHSPLSIAVDRQAEHRVEFWLNSMLDLPKATDQQYKQLLNNLADQLITQVKSPATEQSLNSTEIIYLKLLRDSQSLDPALLLDYATSQRWLLLCQLVAQHFTRSQSCDQASIAEIKLQLTKSLALLDANTQPAGFTTLVQMLKSQGYS